MKKIKFSFRSEIHLFHLRKDWVIENEKKNIEVKLAEPLCYLGTSLCPVSTNGRLKTVVEIIGFISLQ